MMPRWAHLLLNAVVLAAMLPRIADAENAIPSRAEIERVLAVARNAENATQPLRPLSIVLLADRKDHGPRQHDYPRWQSRWVLLLGGSAASTEPAANMDGPDVADASLAGGATQIRVTTAWQWPDAAAWDSADVIVAFCYLPWNADRIAQVDRYLQRGGGLVVVHAATWTKPKASLEVAAVLGVGGFTRWRHGPVAMEITEVDHPICAGLPKTFVIDDESYWPPTPPLGADVQVLATSNEPIASDPSQTSPQPMFWTFQRGKGRVVGCVPGHFNSTFDHPYFRILLLRSIAFAAGQSPQRFDALVLRGLPATGKKSQ